jgi:signal transduction histidine kinase
MRRRAKPARAKVAKLPVAAKQEGTGLALALCRKFVELHGGKIRVTSEVGADSTFTFSIPVRRGE